MIPLLILRLYVKSIKQPSYRHRIHERLACFSSPKQKISIWIHAVSLGEVIAAAPLINQLLIRYPQKNIVLTTTTPTGSAKALSLFSNRLFHVYVPFDAPCLIKRFLKKTNPQLVIIMETEIWPNWYAICKQKNISVIIANARLSERSQKGYQRIGKLTKQALNNTEVILAQTQEDADRYIELGAKNVKILGNIKFDMPVPKDIHTLGQKFRYHWNKYRPVWIAASTHQGEEEIILAAHQKIKKTYPDSLLILVPRHPERFTKILALSQTMGFDTRLRSDLEKTPTELLTHMDTLLGNSIGEMLLFISAADVAFVGGSLIKQGGHNILEPAALYIPVITGPHMFNFQKIYDEFFDSESIITVTDVDSLAQAILMFFSDPLLREEYASRGFKIIEQNQGAMEKHLNVFENYLK
jgi:3-deoxy-D-manno-octulosonic-acid transferase